MEILLQNLIDAVSLGSLYALLALGLALIFGIMRLVNFAYGELIMVGGYTMLLLVHRPLLVWILGTIGVVVIIALAMERVAFRPVRQARPSTLLVTSFAVSFLLQNVAMLTMGSMPKAVGVSSVLVEPFLVGNLRIPRINVFTVSVTLVLLVGLVVFLQRTSLGIQMRAAAEDFRMARLLGVRANTVIATAFGISGVLAATVALLFVAQTGTISPAMGVEPMIVAFVATVIGGMNSLPGATLGGFLVGCLTVALQVLLPIELRPYRQAFTFALVIAFLLFRPQGLLPGRSAGRRA